MIPNARWENKTPVRRRRYGTAFHAHHGVNESLLVGNHGLRTVGCLLVSFDTIGQKTKTFDRTKKHPQPCCRDPHHSGTTFTSTLVGGGLRQRQPNTRNASIPRAATKEHRLLETAGTCRPQASPHGANPMIRDRGRHETLVGQPSNKPIDNSLRFTPEQPQDGDTIPSATRGVNT